MSTLYTRNYFHEHTTLPIWVTRRRRPMTDQTDTTRKIKTIATTENEVGAALTAYLKAYDAYVEQRTTVNRTAMQAAYDHLQEIKKLYDEGHKIKRNRAVFGGKK